MSGVVPDPAPETELHSTPDFLASPYQSLYRRYRPQKFSQVRGQDLVVNTLKNAVRDSRIVHAYLFSGPRGTGKTSTARILAKALNCTDPEDGEPCGVCESCVDITRGSSLDVHELDAASNNGVDAMRDLVARAALATPGKHKVYIIDEVHMLSTAASNALLKTLEEPPEHVVFVLATTDPQKVLPTIRSRTQHFEFHLLEQPVLESLLSDIAADAGLDIPDEGIEAAVKRGHGSARDALSVLDQVAASGVVGEDEHFLRTLISAMAEQDTQSALRAVGEAAVAGLDAQRLGVELVEALREQFLASVARHVVRPDAEMTAGDGRAILSPARSVRALEVIGKALVDMRDAIDPRTTLEVAIVRLTSPGLDESSAALIDRIDRLEQRIAELEQRGPSTVAPAAGPPSAPARPAAPPSPVTPATPVAPASPVTGGARPALGAFRQQQAPQPAPPNGPPPAPPRQAAPERTAPAVEPEASAVSPAPAAPAAAPPTRDDLVTAWADSILPSLKPRLRAMFAAGRWTGIEGSEAIFALPNAAHVEHAAPLAPDVAAAVSAHFGQRLGLRLAVDAALGAVASDESSAAAAPAAPRASRRPAPSPAAEPASRPEVVEEIEDIQDIEAETEAVGGSHDTASWVEDRVREVFPGIEEVTE
jgi:DNA polymerase-3 subunit gamma/tau